MRRLFLIILSLVLLTVAVMYVFLPSTFTISETAGINCVPDAAARTLANQNLWSKWWPGKINTAAGKDAQYQLNATVYTVSQKMLNTLSVAMRHGNVLINSRIILLNIPKDSSIIKWECTVYGGSNLFHRIKAYREALAIKDNMHTVIIAAQKYLSRFENIYGSTFKESSTVDTLLITTRIFSREYPTTDFIYSLVNKLKSFCQGGKCNITGIPMMNVTTLDTGGYRVMAALPIDHPVAIYGNIQLQKMIPGKFIIADVTGGPWAIEETHRQLLHYFQDYHRTSMAIPFEYLVTDRSKEPDTAKWATRIYYPVY